MNISRLKPFILNYPFLTNLLKKIYHWLQIKKNRNKNQIINNGIGAIIKDIIGINNIVEIRDGSKFDKLHIRIRGDNNKLFVGCNCIFGPHNDIWIEGDNNTIKIGDNCTFTRLCHLNAQERDNTIEIGEDCMLSNNIIIRSSDSHPIYDSISNTRINPSSSIKIGKHVWIAPNTKIMKNAVIPDNCIIGSDTTVSKVFNEENCLIVGRPACIVKKNVYWTREQLF